MEVVETLVVKLDVIWNQHWNTERVIVFQTVILKRIRLLPGARNIGDRINSSL